MAKLLASVPIVGLLLISAAAEAQTTRPQRRVERLQTLEIRGRVQRPQAVTEVARAPLRFSVGTDRYAWPRTARQRLP